MMKFKLFILAILFVTVSLLIVPDLTHTPVSGQADKSFKGTIAPFVPPSSSERLGSLPGNNFEFDDDEEVVGDQEEEEEEIDRDKLPVLTKQERDEFLSDDNIDAIEPDRLTALSQEETIDDDIDPISSIVKEIVKNETIIGDEESVPSPESSIIKFKDQNLEQILAAQEVAPEPDNQTISTTKEGQLPLNVTEDDFEIEQADEISESESPDVDVQSFINETANEVPTATTTDNETAVTTTEEDAVEEEEKEKEPTAPTTDNETAVTTTEEDAVEEEEEEKEPTAPTTDNETAVTTTEEDAVEEEEEEKEPTAPTTDNETAVTTEDTVEGKPSEVLQMDPEIEDEIQDIKGEQQTEQAQQEEEADEAQTSQLEEESPTTEPIAQDGSVTTSENKQLNIKLNANDADGDNLSFTIVDDPSNGQLGNVNPSTNTVTYTPDEDYSGEDNFTFIVNDGTSDSNEATVSITVEEQQQREQAQQEEEADESQTPQEEQEEEEDSQQEEED